MGDRQLKLTEAVKANQDQITTSSREKIEKTHTEEIVIGFCSPIGAIKRPVIDEIETQLTEDYKYKTIRIKVTDFIDKYYKESLKIQEGETEPYATLIHRIKGGNNLREKTKNKSVLAELAIAVIHNERNDEFKGSENEVVKSEDLKSRRVCYLIDSLKTKEEIKLLRSIYRDLFYLFGIFSPQFEREKILNEKELAPNEIRKIIEIDDYEESEYGQDVRNAFIESDFFLRTTKLNQKEIKFRIRRYLNLLFNSEIVTPYSHEIAMYEAKSAAGNSACLSRQVGATITDEDCNIISKGWNDVPKFGGNLYTEDDKENDMRCMKLGKCFNDESKNELTKDIVNEIIKIDGINELNDQKSSLKEQIYKIVRNSKLKNLIEFSRSVHAEMHAIITGAQLSGDKMINGKLFCTTYPCHNCARHIIASGIKEIYFIEPYKKSLCTELHFDSITEDENEVDKVKILIYDGVSPRKYLKFFSKTTSRKNKEGNIIIPSKDTIFPKNSLSLQALNTLESQALHKLNSTGLIENNG